MGVRRNLSEDYHVSEHKRCDICGGLYAGPYCGAPACVKASASRVSSAAGEPEKPAVADEPEPEKPATVVGDHEPESEPVNPPRARRQR